MYPSNSHFSLAGAAPGERALEGKGLPPPYIPPRTATSQHPQLMGSRRVIDQTPKPSTLTVPSISRPLPNQKVSVAESLDRADSRTVVAGHL